jgi:hypothetical protein
MRPAPFDRHTGLWTAHRKRPGLANLSDAGMQDLTPFVLVIPRPVYFHENLACLCRFTGLAFLPARESLQFLDA